MQGWLARAPCAASTPLWEIRSASAHTAVLKFAKAQEAEVDLDHLSQSSTAPRANTFPALPL
eukprot:6486746-Amphidinium_carterae.4